MAFSYPQRASSVSWRTCLYFLTQEHSSKTSQLTVCEEYHRNTEQLFPGGVSLENVRNSERHMAKFSLAHVVVVYRSSICHSHPRITHCYCLGWPSAARYLVTGPAVISRWTSAPGAQESAVQRSCQVMLMASSANHTWNSQDLAKTIDSNQCW